ncbi:DUF2934 domain-containing protein [Caballeronia sp. SBC2]|uniref:DUF2934 domain-containing protein n=1 Tax=Caballeronia sp. SBC2 TaxID=2705547 RepID=UPI0013E1922A|nr:DUF2934 domain-containing protein [Caballeronia sp. SBC2]QIE29634.1 hypothetical protein SBC2_77100 [Caballeronia sp. SBC2]
MNSDLDARIRTRAYHIWENAPTPDDDPEKHWDEARRQIEAEGNGAQHDSELNVDQSSDRERGDRLAPVEQLQDVAGSVEPASVDAANFTKVRLGSKRMRT